METLQKCLYSGWVKTYYYNKLPNSLPLMCGPSRPHSCSVCFLLAKTRLKWTTSQLSKSPYRRGELVTGSCLSVYKNGTGKENRFGSSICICVSAGYNKLTHVISYLRVGPAVSIVELVDFF